MCHQDEILPHIMERRRTNTRGNHTCLNGRTRTKAPSVAAALSLICCCILRSSYEGFRSPSSSVVRSCWRRRCSDAAVRQTSCLRRVPYELWRKWRDDAVKLGPNSTGGKLGLYLSKLHLRVRLAEWWPFEADRRNSDGLRCLCHSWGGLKASVLMPRHCRHETMAIATEPTSDYHSTHTHICSERSRAQKVLELWLFTVRDSMCGSHSRVGALLFPNHKHIATLFIHVHAGLQQTGVVHESGD